MIPDILSFVQKRIAARIAVGLEVIPASDETIVSESKKIRDTFGLELPDTYLDICRLTDGLSGENGETLLGLGTYFDHGSQFPAYEGIMEVQERYLTDIGEQQLVEFGNRDGTDPWGWYLPTRSFVRTRPGGLEVIRAFDSFDEMFIDLFSLSGMD
jgi:hypothetical protein